MTCSLATFHASDAVTVFSADQVSTLPATNLLKRTVFDRWRTPGTTGQVTFSNVSGTVSQIVLLYANATAVGTVRVRAGTNTTTVTSAPNFDSGALDHQPGTRDWSTWPRTHFLLDLSQSVTRPVWRIDINQGTGSYEAARVGLLDPYRPSRGIDWGDRIIPISGSRLRRSRNGTAHPVTGGIWREAELVLTSETEAEFLASYGDLRRRVEARIPLLYCKRPRAVEIGAPVVGGGLMYRDDNLMDDLIYGYHRDLAYPENDERTVRRLRLSIDEAVHP